MNQLHPVSSHKFRGFLPVYQKELAYWFGTKRWITQLIIWISLTTVPAIWITPNDANDRGVSYLTVFLWLSGSLIAIGTIILSQNTLIEEKLTQTLLWICAKPLSRSALILAKFAAYATLIGTLALGIPAILTYIAAVISGLSTKVSLLNYLIGIAMVYLISLFVLSLTIMLGAICNKVSSVSAIALFVLLCGASLNTHPLLRKIEPYGIWSLQRYATQTLVGQFPGSAAIAISVSILLTLLCLFIAIQQMQKYEF